MKYRVWYIVGTPTEREVDATNADQAKFLVEQEVDKEILDEDRVRVVAVEEVEDE